MLFGYEGKSIVSKYYCEWRQWPAPIIITEYTEFNKLLRFMYNHCKRAKLTINGHLDKTVMGNKYCKVSKTKSNCAYLMVYNGKIYHFKFWPGYSPDAVSGVTGTEAWRVFRKYAEQDGNWLEKYLTNDMDEIMAIKSQIDKPLICLNEGVEAGIDAIYSSIPGYSIVHIDLNSAYPAGIAALIPEAKPTILRLYIAKKDGDPKAKAYLNLATGTSQSPNIRCAVAPFLALCAIHWTKVKLLELCVFIEKELHNRVLLFNTDGLWAIIANNKIETLKQHFEFGEELGQWKIDHVVEKIRFKSNGSYEYVENGVYHPVCRGIRKEISNTFKWGDIFSHQEVGYLLIEDEGCPYLKEVNPEEADINVEEDEI